MRKQYDNDARKFYQDYIQEIQLNKNGDHHIEVFKSGKKRYYITKDAYDGTPQATSPGSKVGTDTPIDRSIRIPLGNPNDILNHIYPNYNPQIAISK